MLELKMYENFLKSAVIFITNHEHLFCSSDISTPRR